MAWSRPCGRGRGRSRVPAPSPAPAPVPQRTPGRPALARHATRVRARVGKGLRSYAAPARACARFPSAPAPARTRAQPTHRTPARSPLPPRCGAGSRVRLGPCKGRRSSRANARCDPSSLTPPARAGQRAAQSSADKNSARPHFHQPCRAAECAQAGLAAGAGRSSVPRHGGQPLSTQSCFGRSFSSQEAPTQWSESSC